MKLGIIIILILIVITWAPWLDDNVLRDKIINSGIAKQDGTINAQGEALCNYEVKMFPFGRLMTSCEGNHFVTFWGLIL